MALGGAALLITKSIRDRGFRWVLLFTLIIQLPFLSMILLKYFPPATLVQFPWRFDIWIVVGFVDKDGAVVA